MRGEENGLDAFAVVKKSAVTICSQYIRYAAVTVVILLYFLSIIFLYISDYLSGVLEIKYNGRRTKR